MRLTVFVCLRMKSSFCSKVYFSRSVYFTSIFRYIFDMRTRLSKFGTRITQRICLPPGRRSGKETPLSANTFAAKSSMLKSVIRPSAFRVHRGIAGFRIDAFGEYFQAFPVFILQGFHVQCERQHPLRVYASGEVVACHLRVEQADRLSAVADDIHYSGLFPLFGRFPIALVVFGTADDLHQVLRAEVYQVAGEGLLARIACDGSHRTVFYLGRVNVHLGRRASRGGQPLLVKPAYFHTVEFHAGHSIDKFIHFLYVFLLLKRRLITIRTRAKTAIRPVHIWNHCQPVGSFITLGGSSFTSSEVSFLIRTSSSVSRITCRARLSQVAVTSMLSPDIRETFTVACPLRLLKPVPIGIVFSISVGNTVFAMLGGTGSCRSANCFTLCWLSLRCREVVTVGTGLLQLEANRAIIPVMTSSSASHRAVQSGDSPVEFSVFIDRI
nr:MAG TPA: hypothetical protein [Bacteriophage sp.]